jgi:NMD protein affecting ribosome stability and mRNA decay
MTKSKGLIRSLTRGGTADGRASPAERRLGRPREGAVCERCGAVFARRTWRRDRPVTHARLERASWTVCPACTQVQRSEYCGRVVVGGRWARTNEAALRRRIANVASRAAATQPERRLVSVERRGAELEILTTSQKLAHRIVSALKKTFRGRATYAWSDDGTLFATWRRDDGARSRPRA